MSRHGRASAVTGAVLALVISASATSAQHEPSPKTATFSMYCYWTGEATLGRVGGVIASRIGHWGRHEIVQVDYDPEQTNLGELVDALKSQRSFYSLVAESGTAKREAERFVPTNEISELSGSPRFIDSKYNLRQRHPELSALDLTERQAIALNSWSYFGGVMPDVLTADQKKKLPAR